ncbi:MAG: putative motility protein [Burkholderiales bacterium]|nr:putative motility protein [Burkholderiales bacterium]
MDSISATAVSQVASAQPGTLNVQAAIMVLRKALDFEAANNTQLIESLPQTTLATAGSLGTRLNLYA